MHIYLSNIKDVPNTKTYIMYFKQFSVQKSFNIDIRQTKNVSE